MADCHSTAVADCHGDATANDAPAESCGTGCGPAKGRPDWFLWTCLAGVLLAYGWGTLMVGTSDDGAVAQFTGGVVELMNRMW